MTNPLSNSLAIFDLSGTLTVERGGPPNMPGEVVLVDGARDVVRWLENSSASVYIASNQGGVAYGYLDIDTCDAIMSRCAMLLDLPKERFFWCPHHPKGNVSPWNKACYNRKPNPGMLLTIMQETGVPSKRTLFVGDRKSDVDAAGRAGAHYVHASPIRHVFGRAWSLFSRPVFIIDGTEVARDLRVKLVKKGIEGDFLDEMIELYVGPAIDDVEPTFTHNSKLFYAVDGDDGTVTQLAQVGAQRIEYVEQDTFDRFAEIKRRLHGGCSDDVLVDLFVEHLLVERGYATR
jgi:D-glycero-D-manno-heptose 1,7-bisphosphate phosphatase